MESYELISNTQLPARATRFPQFLRSVAPVVAALVVLVAVAAFAFTSYSSNTVTLPLRVMGVEAELSDPQSRAVAPAVQLNVPNPSGVNELYLKVHNLNYEGMGSVRLNGGEWIPLDNQTVTCSFPESELGCVGGAYATIRFTVPVSDVRSGANQVEFSFNGTDGRASVYRVLEIDLRRGQNSALRGTSFANDDPATWSPPRPDQASIEAGEALWYARRHLIDHPDGPAIKAACADCHAKDGRDLQYFSYSNASIINRSEFHGLSRTEGEQIASYIRSIVLEDENGNSYEAPGTPWDPPYQPGPELMATGQHPDASPQQYWAAGAGLDWVLDRDEDALPYLFPDGLTGEAAVERASVDGTLNMRELPVAMQMPDWNNWLPDVHPMDAWGNRFLNSQAWDVYNDEIDQPLSDVQIGEAGRRIKRLGWKTGSFMKRASKPGGASVAQYAEMRLSVRQWALVKTWEAMHGNALENKAPALHEYGEARSWISTTRTVFDLAPHLVGLGNSQRAPFTYGSRMKDNYFSHAWYHLQVIMNASNRSHTSQGPVDWKYQFNFLGEHVGSSGLPASTRYIASWIKMTQQLQGPGDQLLSPNGWGPQQIHPVRIVKFACEFRGCKRSTNSNLTTGQRRQVTETLLTAWMDHAESYDLGDWPREGDGRSRRNDSWERPDYLPRPGRGAHYWANRLDFASRAYQMAPVMSDMNVSSSVVSRFATWGKQMWPLGDWDSYISDGEDTPPENQAPTIRITNLSEGDAIYSTEDVFIEVDAFDPDGEIAKVEFFADRRLSRQTEAPFEYAWEDPPLGRHRIKVKASDNDGATARASVTIHVIPDPNTAQHTLPLRRGWNLISSWVDPVDDNLDAVFSDALDSVVLVKDGRGRAFIPSAGIDNIGGWDPTQGYMAYLSQEAVIEIAGTSLSDDPPAIELRRGWNQVAYLRDEPMALSEALGSVIDRIALVKDYAGNIYFPAYGVDNIGTMNPGQGYKIYATRNAQLRYPTEGPATASNAMSSLNLSNAGTKAPLNTSGVPSSAVILVRAPGMQDGQRVSAWSETHGKVGEGVVQGGSAAITVRGDEQETPNEVEGAQVGDALTLKVASSAQGEPEEMLALATISDGISGESASELLYESEALYVAEVQTDAPRSFSLSGNYPNPFRRNTTIEYNLPETAEVELTVFDILGRRVAVLVNEKKNAGSYKVEVKGASLPSGVYLYRLNAGDFEASGKMTLLK